MKWNNLLLNQCPKCWKKLTPKEELSMAVCSCGFAISFEKMNKIAMKIKDEQIDTKESGIGDRNNDDVL